VREQVMVEAGSYLRLIDSCITQLTAQGPSRTCNESKEEDEEQVIVTRTGYCYSREERHLPCQALGFLTSGDLYYRPSDIWGPGDLFHKAT